MITTATDYFEALFKIYPNGNTPSLVQIVPSHRNEDGELVLDLYNINLNERTIEAPEFLSVLDDHHSETIYFLVDRYFDNMDLSTTACVIQYINANKEGRLYAVPFYDIETYHDDNKMIIPWCIEGEATKAAGDVTYSIRFYKTDENKKFLTYNLNTLPATSKVLNGINILDGYIAVDVDKQLFNTGSNVYFTKDANGKTYTKATTWAANTQYYTLTDGYNYDAKYLEDLLARIANLERDTQSYWYDATDRQRMLNY